MVTINPTATYPRDSALGIRSSEVDCRIRNEGASVFLDFTDNISHLTMDATTAIRLGTELILAGNLLRKKQSA